MKRKKSAEQRMQENLKRLEEMCLMDDLLMSKCFEDDPIYIQLVLRIVLEMPDLTVIKVTTQRAFVSLKTRSLRLDIVAVDGKGRVYNIEMQRDDAGASTKRARYHSSTMDVNILKKGEDFDDLPETYVIFITEHDVMKKGWPVYRYERRLEGTGEALGDGSYIVYVNGAYRGDSSIGKLMEDFACTDPSKMHYPELAERTRYFKEDRKGKMIMCKAMQENFDEGDWFRREETATKMLRKGRLPLDEIAEYSGFPPDLVKELKTELEAETRKI